MDIRLNDVTGEQVIALLEEHHQDMLLHSPIESVHALDVSGLQAEGVKFWCAWLGDELAGCGALKHLDAKHAELKSMRTASKHLRKGVAAGLLKHILKDAQESGYQQLSLETGSMAAFAPAWALYQSFGFEFCGPFANYQLDPYSKFMSKSLASI